VLEASYLLIRLPPYHVNFGKRLVKTPKLYFLDKDLAAALLGIRDADALSIHAQRGALFETWVVSELVAQRFNGGRPAELYFWCDNTGNEIDLLFEVADRLQAVEIKSGATFAGDWLKGPKRWQKLAGDQAARPLLIHGGEQGYEREGVKVLPWRSVGEVLPAERV
jgi:predicted AAA+ superfamily ATPase